MDAGSRPEKAQGDAASRGAACELVVFAAHPDDAELCCGGLLLVSAKRGWRAAVVDMTRGELGSLGTAEIRAREAEEAAKVLGLACRRNLELPDGRVRDTDAGRLAVVRAIRELRPRVVIAPPRDDHHPDHMGACELVRHSFYLAGVRKYLPELEPWRPRILLHFAGSRIAAPALVVDVTEVAERRMQAIRCYRSQFDPPQQGFPLRISAAHYLESIRARLAHYGSLIGVPLGEPYLSEVPIPVTDLVGLFEIEPWKDR